MVASAVDAFGGLHVLVNNAGILGAFTPLVDSTVEHFMKVLSVNLIGPFLGIKTAAPAIRDSGGGSIVNLSSTAGMWGVPFAADYTASKFGVRGLTKVAALELGHDGIRVNSVHPGGVLTEMVKAVGDDGQSSYYKRLPAGRIGTTEDITNLVLFLASDESAYCTGTEFVNAPKPNVPCKVNADCGTGNKALCNGARFANGGLCGTTTVSSSGRTESSSGLI